MQRSRAFIRACGLIGLAGCVGVIACDVIAWTVLLPTYDPLSQVISDLAVGRASWLSDLGLCLLAAGFLSVGLGLCRWHPSGAPVAAVAAIAALLGLDVLVITLVHEYAGQANLGGNVHTLAVAVLGLSFALACFLAAPMLTRLGKWRGRASVAVGTAWIVLAPLLFLVPGGWNGAYERLLGLILVGWLAAMAATVLRHGRA